MPPLAAQRDGAPARDRDGVDLDRVLHLDDLVRGDNVFFSATGITDGELVRRRPLHRQGATTESLVMRSRSGTIPDDPFRPAPLGGSPRRPRVGRPPREPDPSDPRPE